MCLLSSSWSPAEGAFGADIDYARLVKIYGEAPDAEKRYSPAECIRSEEHTSELQSRRNLVCRLLLEKKQKKKNRQKHYLA